jgi:hypothetical protein
MKCCLRKFILCITFLLMMIGCSQEEKSPATMGFPVNTDGIVFTVISIDDLAVHDPETGKPINPHPAKIMIRIKNLEHEQIKVQPDAFSIMNVDGTQQPVSLIFDGEEPKDASDLGINEQLIAGVIFSTETDLENLTLSYTPTIDSKSILIQLIQEDNASELPFKHDEMKINVLQLEGLPEGIILVEPPAYAMLLIADSAKYPSNEEPAELISMAIMDENGNSLGFLWIAGYASIDSVDGIFTSFATDSTHSPQVIDNLGEQAVLLGIDEAGNIPRLIFARCHVLTNIYLNESEADDSISFDDLSAFTQNLDHLLTELACD